MLRLLASVTLRPGIDPARPVALLRAMAEAEPNVLAFEAGPCEPTRPGAACATDASTATFQDRAAYVRDASGASHDELAAEVAPLLERCVPVLSVLSAVDPA